MGMGRGLLGLLGRDRLCLLRHPLMGRLQRLCELLFLALMMSVGTHDRLATMGDIGPTVVNHPLEAEFLNLVALAVYPRPLGDLERLLDLRGSPRHEGLARGWFAKHKEAGASASVPVPSP